MGFCYCRMESNERRTMIIELPFPDARLNPNQSNGKSWKSTLVYRDAAKQTGYIQARSALENQTLPPAPYYSISITFLPPDRRHRDADNLHAAMKNYIDGVCSALKINDAKFRSITLSFGEPRNPGATIVEIKPLEAE